MPAIAQRYAELRAHVPGSVRIVAVTKFQPLEAIDEALDAGVTEIAENYVQEAQRKFSLPEVFGHGEVSRRAQEGASVGDDRMSLGDDNHAEVSRRLATVTKHFIGHVQTNKAKAIVETFDLVQSVDREKAAAALDQAAGVLNKRLPVLVQLNISPAERFGCAPEEADALAEFVRSREHLALDGVMAIGPDTQDRTEIARAFDVAARVFSRVGGSTLSIGMSADWREAVAAGSTMIRVGTTIFGPRPARPASKNAVM